MKLKIFLGIFILLIIILQASIFTLPFLPGIFVMFSVLSQKKWVIFAAFLSGILFDILAFKTIGTTSIFLTILVFLIYIYKNKFEIQNSRFVFIAVSFFSFLFLIIMGFDGALFQAILTGVIFSGSFHYLQKHLMLK